MSDPLPPHPLDELGPVLARWLAPFIAAELNIKPQPSELSADYDDATCRVFISGVGDAVLPRAELFFGELHRRLAVGEPGLDSLELAKLLGTDSPRNIASLLTTSLKRRAKALGLPVPWTEESSPDNRTVWVDRDGIAARMYPLFDESHWRRIPESSWPDGTRKSHPADDEGGPYSAAHRAKLSARDVVEDA